VLLESTAGNKLEKMVCKGDPLSTLVKVGGCSALGVAYPLFCPRSLGALQPAAVCCISCWQHRAR
jgi:hypothetical protein